MHRVHAGFTMFTLRDIGMKIWEWIGYVFFGTPFKTSKISGNLFDMNIMGQSHRKSYKLNFPGKFVVVFSRPPFCIRLLFKCLWTVPFVRQSQILQWLMGRLSNCVYVILHTYFGEFYILLHWTISMTESGSIVTTVYGKFRGKTYEIWRLRVVQSYRYLVLLRLLRIKSDLLHVMCFIA